MGAHSLEAGPRRLAAIAAVLADLPLAELVRVDDDGRVVGVVSEADLLPKEAFSEDGRGLHGREGSSADALRVDAVTAGDLMTTPAVTVAPDVSLARAARIMARDRVKRLPVVDRAGFLKGIVSRSDLLKIFLRGDADIAEEVRREVVVRLFGTHAERVRVHVDDGVVTLTGRIRRTALVPLAVRLARAVPGVVDVRCELSRPPVRPDSDSHRSGGQRPAPA
ncbi:CBS domain-containing protein [Streptomyces collinus]|uniref:CBS domain-containing protein n=1 Tax=Streptomyces collinus TaxID=42684 RepID=UPI00367B863A